MAVYRNNAAIIIRIMLILWVFLWPGGRLLPAAEEKPENRQPDVVYNLCKFVSWPREAFTSPELFYIFVKDSKDHHVMMDLTDRALLQRTIRVRMMQGINPPSTCQVLYIDACSDAVVQKILDGIRKRPILTVSPRKGFAAGGGMVELIAAADRVRFHINLDAAKTAGLTIKAPLLQIADDIRGMDTP